MGSVDSGREESAPGCPVNVGADDGQAGGRDGGRLGVRGVLRMPGRVRLPVLHGDVPEYRQPRQQTVGYLTPARVETAYQGLICRLADEQCDTLLRRGSADLSVLSFRLAVAVAAEVVGLTEGRGSMAKRVDRLFRSPDPDARGLRAGRQRVVTDISVLALFWRDVRPAIAARRRSRRDDLISHLIDKGGSRPEILGEWVTFVAAGMVATREFITVAAWHLLTDEPLRVRYTAGDGVQRAAVLHEILRREPAALLRWTATGPGEDEGTSRGEDAEADVRESAHCPGAHLAFLETDIFLSKLFALPGLRLLREPTVTIRPDLTVYELKGLLLAV